jgi:hypothetical protein
MSTKNFFATRDDAILVSEGYESKIQIEYVLSGRVGDAVSPQRYAKAALLPSLGQADANSAGACSSFLIVPMGAPVTLRFIGGVAPRLVVDQLMNPASVVICFGGLLGSSVLISGHVGTASNDKAAKKIERAIIGEMRRRWSVIRGDLVGVAAYDMLKRGARLTPAIRANPSIDLSVG